MLSTAFGELFYASVHPSVHTNAIDNACSYVSAMYSFRLVHISFVSLQLDRPCRECDDTSCPGLLWQSLSREHLGLCILVFSDVAYLTRSVPYVYQRVRSWLCLRFKITSTRHISCRIMGCGLSCHVRYHPARSFDSVHVFECLVSLST